MVLAPGVTSGQTLVGLAWSSAADGDPVVGPQYRSAEEHDSAIDRVVGKVLGTWLDAAPASRQAELELSRPSIPSEVDRALLTDLSGDLGVYDLSPEIRYWLRERFWRRVDEPSTRATDTI